MSVFIFQLYFLLLHKKLLLEQNIRRKHSYNSAADFIPLYHNFTINYHKHNHHLQIRSPHFIPRFTTITTNIFENTLALFYFLFIALSIIKSKNRLQTVIAFTKRINCVVNSNFFCKLRAKEK